MNKLLSLLMVILLSGMLVFGCAESDGIKKDLKAKTQTLMSPDDDADEDEDEENEEEANMKSY